MVLTGAHYIFIGFIIIILATMVLKKDTIVPCMVGIFLIGLFYTGSIVASTSAVFNSLIVALSELGPVILIISILVSLAKVLEANGCIEYMTKPFSKIIKNETTAFFAIGITSLVLTWFFWPSPTVALIGAVFLPIAINAGLPVIWLAVAMNLFAHGIGLSTDFVIQGAPAITAGAAGVSVSDIMSDGMILFITMSVVTVFTAFFMMKRDLKKEKRNIKVTRYEIKYAQKTFGIKTKISTFIVLVAFVLDVICMSTFDLKGGDATALIGGTAMFLLFITTAIHYKQSCLDEVCSKLVEGFNFGMKIFAVVIPIAAFFYLGEVAPLTTVFGDVLPQGSQGLLSDTGIYLSQIIPLNKFMVSIMEMGVGVITGLDGGGFSGMSLAGSLASVFGSSTGSNVAALGALGQIGAIWTGGGCLIPWALIPVAAICGVNPIELAKKNFIPVVTGLIVTTIVAMFLI